MYNHLSEALLESPEKWEKALIKLNKNGKQQIKGAMDSSIIKLQKLNN